MTQRHHLTHARRTKLRLASLACLLVSIVPLTHAGLAAIPGTPCSGPAAVAAVGSTSQGPVHLQLFIPAYEASCPPASGTISYQSLGGQVAIDHMVRRDLGPDVTTAPYAMFTSDLQMSDQEWYSLYTDFYHPFRPRLATVAQHFPVMINAFGIGYNLSGCGVTDTIRLTRPQLSLIYSGAVTRWNDVALRSNGDNAQLATCNLPMNVVVRADYAASSFVVKDYLSQGNTGAPWVPYKNNRLNPVWPTPLRPACFGVGEAGMRQCLSTPGAIGYLEYSTAKANNIVVAQLENSAPGSYFLPSENGAAWPDQCVLAAQAVSPRPTTTSYDSVTLTGTRSGYPLCAFSYILTYQAMMAASENRYSTGAIRNTVDYLNSIASDAVLDRVKEFGYAPIPGNWRATVRQGIAGISYF